MKPHFNSLDLDLYLDLILYQIWQTLKYQSPKLAVFFLHQDPWIILWEIKEFLQC